MSGTKPLIAVTMGDPAGIGPEVIVRALALPSVHRVCLPIVFGIPEVLAKAVRVAGVPIPVKVLRRFPPKNAGSKPSLWVLRCSKFDPDHMKPGRPTAETGRAAYDCIEAAVRLALKGEVSAIATGPISKTALAAAGLPYPGHTEMLAELCGVTEVGMLMVAPTGKPPGRSEGRLRILLVTTHASLKSVPGSLTPESVLAAIRLAHRAGRRLFALKNPRVAVAALNPHAGENGLFGTEEASVILPAIRRAHQEGFTADGPFPADTLIPKAAAGRYDFVIAMYHDQAMIPVKLLSFGRTVNVTVGLPIIRTSVDHGTGYDIAWQGKANPASLVEAIRLAARLVRNSRRPALNDAH